MDQARHVAIIMDGNGRWARQQGKSRRHGHREGVKALERTARAAADSEEIKYLTVLPFPQKTGNVPVGRSNFFSIFCAPPSAMSLISCRKMSR